MTQRWISFIRDLLSMVWQRVLRPLGFCCAAAWRTLARWLGYLAALRFRSVLKFLVVCLAVYGFLKVLPSGIIGSRDQFPVIKHFEHRLPAVEAPREHRVVVFIHGLGGDLYDTWRPTADAPTFMEMLADDPDFSQYEIYTIGYGTDVFANKGRFDTAVRFVQDHLDEDWRDARHIVVIAHSLGGLVAQHAIARSDLRSNERLHQTLTFISLATPFRGSGLADTLKRLTTATSANIDVLTTSNELSSVGSGYWKKYRRDCGGRLVHFAGFERKSLGVGRVVDELSASALVEPGFVCGFDEDHTSICKPIDRSCAVYQTVRNWILAQEAARIEWAQLPTTASLEPGVRYVLNPGEHHIDKDLIVPIGTKLEVQPGAKLVFTQGAILHVRGKLFVGPSKAPGQEIDAQGRKDWLESQPQVLLDFGAAEHGDGAIFMDGPHTEGSYIRCCEIRNGRGVALSKPSPRIHVARTDGKAWHEVVRRDSKCSRFGGGLVAVGANQIDFENCLLEDCSAWQGGAAMLIGSKRVGWKTCSFIDNRSGFGGGGIFLQDSESYLADCTLRDNTTGSEYLKPGSNSAEIRQRTACGGGIYVGYGSYGDVRDCRIMRNHAEYAGGGIYYLGEAPADAALRRPMCSQSLFAHNSADGGGGGAIFLDQQGSLNVTSCRFISNRCGNDLSRPGQDIRDESLNPYYSRDHQSGLAFNLHNTFFRNVAMDKLPEAMGPIIRTAAKVPNDSAEPTAPWLSDEVAVSRRPAEILHAIAIHESPIRKADCFKSIKEGPRAIDTIIIHHVSATQWETDPKLNSISDEDLEAVEELAGLEIAKEPRFEVRRCKRILEAYGVSAHYLIDRGGNVFRLVRDQDIAYHAGKSVMPAPDGRDDVNLFSLGIELVASHPDDDPAMKKDEQYTPAQYTALNTLLVDLCLRYEVPPDRVLGHVDIAAPAGRKKDPEPYFDWKSVRSRLAKDLDL